MDATRLDSILKFLNAAERLKDTLRTAHTSSGKKESTAEHTWRLCLMVMVFEDEFENIDAHRLMKLCVVHDLGEAISGDIPAIDNVRAEQKVTQEREDMHQLCEVLPQDLRNEILALWEEYDAGETQEAILAKGFDKLETILQHAEGKNPVGFDFAFNLEYGRDRTNKDPLLAQIRSILDEKTRSRMDTASD